MPVVEHKNKNINYRKTKYIHYYIDTTQMVLQKSFAASKRKG